MPGDTRFHPGIRSFRRKVKVIRASSWKTNADHTSEVKCTNSLGKTGNVAHQKNFGNLFARPRLVVRATLRAMSAAYDQLLDATIRHLENLQSRGTRHIAVTSETWRALTAPVAAATKSPAAAPRPALVRPNVTAPSPVAPPAPRPATAIPMPPIRNRPTQSASTPAKPAPLREILPFTSVDPAKAAAFTELRTRVLACVQCPNLVAARQTVVFGVGNIDSPLMFVGEAPGADEDTQGEPFVGLAGQLLTKIIEAMAMKRDDVYIANILKCRPDTPGQTSGNRKPTPAEMATCIPYLHEQIDLVKPKVLIALGATAVEGLLGKTVGITKLRGNWQTYRNIPLMPTYHPAYLLRNQALSEKRRVWEDMLQVMEKLELPVSEKQRGFFLRAMK
jgi:uracil-DNA glycosylase family 4